MKFNLITCIFFLLICCACIMQDEKPSAFEGHTMGTTYHIKLIPRIKGPRELQIHDGIKAVLDKVNKQMSTYSEDSEISKYNRLKKGETMKPSAAVYGVIMRAIDIGRDTEGAFDVTVGPLVNLWGFGAQSNKRTIPPSAEEIMEVKKNIGIDYIEIDFVNEVVGKRQENIYIDLAAIAKGYGVDAVATYLAENGFSNYMVEIGGEVRVSGFKDIKNKKRWLVAIEKPLVDKRESGKLLPVTDISMATSGDYRNFFIYQNVRYAHIIDPRTGYPVKNNLTSVTVLSSDCVDADAYATALSVMGEAKGLDFANEKKIKVIFYVRGQDSTGKETFKEVVSKEMEKYLEQL